MAQSNTNERENRTIKRTVCIGLGGTGRDILMRIRRLIVDRYEDLNEFPLVSFVHIDTDKGSISGLKTGNIYHGVDLTFRDAEKVEATMTKQQVNTFVQGVQRDSEDEINGPYAHISQWFPPQLLKDIRGIEEGAQGIRPVGRLAFFHNYRKIKNALDIAEKRTRGHDAFLLKKGLIIEPELNIFLVGSLCGGTGSGMFLDIAYTLRHNYGNQGAKIFSYLVISPELYGNTPIMNANTYAALKELNHYASIGTIFNACYDTQELEIVQEQRPPFEYVYLVSNQTASGYKIIEKSKLSNVIAQKIFLDFGSELAHLINEQRDNFLFSLIQLDEHPRPNVQRYLTFGLAQLYFPRDVSVQVTLNRLRLKLLNFWLNGEGQSPDTKLLIERFLLNWHSNSSRLDPFSLKLEEETKENNKSFTQTINSWRNKVETNISEAKNKQERQAIIEQLPRELRDNFRKVQPGENENTRGIWLTDLQQISTQLTENFKRDISKFLEELLNPGNQDFSLTTTFSFLEALKTELNKYQRNLQDKLQSLGSLYRLDDLEKKWKDTQQNIQDIEQKSGLPFFDKRKHSQVQDEAKNIIQQVYNLVKHNFDLVVNQEAKKIVESLQDYVQNLLTQASFLNNSFNNLRSYYEKKETELKQLNFDEMTGEAIWVESDSDEYYQMLLPENQLRSQLVAVSARITEELILSRSLINFLTDEFLDEKELQEQIDLTVDRIFGSRSSQMVQSVIKRFMQNYSYQNRSARLEQIIREADPLLPLNLSDPYFYNDTRKSIKLIAFKDTDEQEVKQFKNVLIRDLGTPDNVLKPIQAEDEIIILSEYGGFPLRLINGLEQMRRQYFLQKDHGAFLHNDYRTVFTDMVPPDARKIEDLQNIFYPCLGLNLLGYNSATKRYEFDYKDDFYGTAQKISISLVWSEALEFLASREDMTQTLKGILDEAIATVEKQPSIWQEQYLPLLREFKEKVEKLPENHPNYLYKDKVIGTRATIDTPMKEGIIDRFWRRMAQKIHNLPQVTTIEAISPQQMIKASETLNDDIIDVVYPSTPQKDSMNELRELIQMREKGHLTETEFEAAKKQILGM